MGRETREQSAQRGVAVGIGVRHSHGCRLALNFQGSPQTGRTGGGELGPVCPVLGGLARVRAVGRYELLVVRAGERFPFWLDMTQSASGGSSGGV